VSALSVLGLLQATPTALCPLCHFRILDPAASSDPQAVVDALPTDVAMAALVESRLLLRGQHNCLACQTEVSSHVCLTCHDRFCSRCAAAHKRLTATRDHNIQELTNVTADQLASDRPEFCKVHINQVHHLYSDFFV
jgi:hypothetical protein